MGRLVVLHFGQELPQHVAEAEHGIDLQAVRFAGQRRQRVIGAENVAGAVDQEEVVALFQRARGRIVGTARRARVFGLGRCLGGGFRGGFLDFADVGMARMWAVSRSLINAASAASGPVDAARFPLPGVSGETGSRLRIIPPAARPVAVRSVSAWLGHQPEHRRPLEQELQRRCRAPPRTSAASRSRRTAVTSTEMVPISVMTPVLSSKAAGRRHRQEEGEIDDDRVAAAIAQRLEHVVQRQQRGDGRDRGGADQAHAERIERQRRQPRCTMVALKTPHTIRPARPSHGMLCARAVSAKM